MGQGKFLKKGLQAQARRSFRPNPLIDLGPQREFSDALLQLFKANVWVP